MEVVGGLQLLMEIGEQEERCWILLLLLKKLRKIVTRTKLQKLIFLIQDESRIKGGYDFSKNHHGPHSYRLTADAESLAQEGIVTKEEVVGSNNRLYYVYEATKKVDEIYDNEVCPNVDTDLIARADKVIDKYKDCDYNQLTEYIYKQYLPKYKEYKNRYQNMLIEMSYIEKLWEDEYTPESDVVIDVMSSIEYIKLIFQNINKNSDRVVKGVLLNASEDMLENLYELTEKYFEKDYYDESLSYLNDLFHFIDYYSDKNDVYPSLTNLDFSEFLSEEEMERLQQIETSQSASKY